MLQPVLQNPWVRALGVLVALILVSILLYALKPVLVPLFLALLVAYVLDPVVDFFEKRRVPRMLSILGLAIVACLIALSFPLIVVPSLFQQGQELIASAKNGVRGGELLDNLLDRLPVNELVERLNLDTPASAPAADSATPVPPEPVEPAQEDVVTPPVDPAGAETAPATPVAPEELPPPTQELSRVDARALLAEYIGNSVTNFAVQFAKNHATSLASFGQRAGMNVVGFLHSIGQGLFNFILFIANFALFAVVAGYLLKDFDPLKASAASLIPPRHAPKALRLFGDIDVQLRSFLRGQMTVCLCLSAMYTVGFLICGVPFAILIGIFSLGASFIPFVGVFATAVLAVTLTLLQHGIDWHLLGVLIVVVIAQFLEGNVLTPKIVGEQVGLNPVWVILAIMVFGNFLGFLGLLLAVPIAAVLKVLVVEGVQYYKASPLFEGPDGVVVIGESDDVEVVRRKKRR